ncbi:hypothetical protein [Frondihabitans sucicola]|uniref:hypothetical protein n=1 Tax=Frondihabitans sucicola TaxID=1268041 RepID=UPI002573A802|nr:hypothetical protein [Frondihabitans sucicola]
MIWGSGGDTEPQLFAQGLLFQNGFDVVDNQLVTTLATQGVIGLVLLVSLFIVGFRTTGRLSRSVLLVMVVMLFSFDYLRFTSMLGLLFGFLALAPATAGARENRPSDIVETGPEPRVPSPCG